ncbi:hypothetical protein Tco_0621698 [Tanacetum coccineum]
MQEADNYGYFYYRGIICCCCKLPWASFVDSKSNVIDMGFNFMNTKIYIDNESTICIVKNPVFHSKIKHIEIRHHFIRDAYEKKLIQVLKIHTDDNVADLLTKAFDVSRRSLYPKQGRKTAKSKPTTHKDQAFNDPDDFGPIDYMETEDAHNEKGVSTEDQVNTVKPDKGTNKPKVSTDKIDEGTTELKNGNSDENATPTATPTVFGDDETIAEFLVSMSQNKAKQKGS